MPIDLVNRFAPTPLQTTVHWSGKVISFATNSRMLLERMAELVPACPEAGAGEVDCLWRVVAEPDCEGRAEVGASIHRYVTDEGVSFLTIGRRSFLAYDNRSGRGICFVSERLVRDRTLFFEAFLAGFAALLEGGKQQW